MKRSLRACICAGLLAPLSFPASAEAYALRFKGEGWLYGFFDKSSYFDSELSYLWLETLLRAQGTLELGDHTVLEARLVGNLTLGPDYYHDDTITNLRAIRYDVRPDLFSLSFERLLDGVLTLKLGRQEISLGDGFLLGDGVDDYSILLRRQSQVADSGEDNGLRGSAQWIIPYKYFDGVSLGADLEPFAVTAMLARLDLSQIGDPYAPQRHLPGLVWGADAAWAGEQLSLGITNVHKQVFGYTQSGDDGLEVSGSATDALSFRAGLAVGDWELAGEAVQEFGNVEDTLLRANAIRLSAAHSWSMNPFEPHIRLGAYYFSGDNPDTETYEGYDALFYDWTDFGSFYLGNAATSYYFSNTDSVVAQLELGFLPNPVHSLRLQNYLILSDTGADTCALLECEGESVGARQPLMVESNLIWEWEPAEVGAWKPDGAFYFGAMAGVGVPLGPTAELAGDATSLQGILFMTVNL